MASDTTRWVGTGSGLIVPRPTSRRYDRPVGVGLFVGAGGMDLGLHQAGYHVAAALEIDFDAATTYMTNLGSRGIRMHFDNDERREKFERHLEKHLGLRPRRGAATESSVAARRGRLAVAGPVAGSGWISHYGCLSPTCDHDGLGSDGAGNEHLASANKSPVHPYGCEHFFIADARAITGAEILEALELERGEVDIVFGGPPCQGFSKASAKSKEEKRMDPRNSLVFDFARIVTEIQPKAFMMENVPQLASMITPEGVPVIDALARVFEDGGMGSYQALRESLVTTAGMHAGVALRTRSRRPVSDLADDEPDAHQGEQQLFDLDDSAVLAVPVVPAGRGSSARPATRRRNPGAEPAPYGPVRGGPSRAAPYVGPRAGPHAGVR